MRINISPKYFAINVLAADRSVDVGLSGKVMNSTKIELPAIRDIFAFQPILQVAITAPVDTILLAAVQFGTFKGDERIHVMQSKAVRTAPTILFKADDVADLTPYKRRNRMVGKWRFDVGITIFRADILKNTSSEKALEDFLASSRYQGLSTFEVEIITSNITDNLNPDGTLRNSARVQQNQEVTVSMDDI